MYSVNHFRPQANTTQVHTVKIIQYKFEFIWFGVGYDAKNK